MKDNSNYIIDHLIKHSLACPDKTAFIILENDEGAEKKISFLELVSRVSMLASGLPYEQLKGKKVLLVYQDILEFIVSFLACQYAGITPVPLPYIRGTKQIERLLSIMDDAQAAAIFCTHHSIAHLQKGLRNFPEAEKTRMIATDSTHPSDIPPSIYPPVYNDIAFIQYTSGSTGNPKGVIVSAENLIHNQHLIKNTFGCTETSVIFSWLPFHHDMGLVGNILHTLYMGCTCVLMSPFHFMQNPRKWLQGISRYGVTHSGGPNFAFELCIDKIAPEEVSLFNLSSWAVAYNGSERIRPETIQRFSHHFKPSGFSQSAFRPCYGLAEATLLVAGHNEHTPPYTILVDREMTPGGKVKKADMEDASARLIISSGRVAEGMTVKIISRYPYRECDELEEGEICISGSSVTKGYWNKDNSDVFLDWDGRPYLKTGDLGFFYQNQLFVHGRLKEMLIIRGRNFYPSDMEEKVVSCHPAIETNGVAIFSVANDGNDEERIAIVAEMKRAALKDLDAESIILSIENTIKGAFGIDPYDILLINPFGIPRTTSGKLQRIKCKDKYRDKTFITIASKSTMPIKRPRYERNELLAAEVVHKGDAYTIKRYLMDIIESKVGRLPQELLHGEAELTEIGIDSLRATEIVNMINKDLNINMDASRISQDNTLTGLSNTLENILWLKNGLASGQEITL